MTFQYCPVLVLPPGLFANIWIEMVVPTLSALLADTAREFIRDEGPLLRAILMHQLHNLLILLCCPRAFHQRGLEHLLPAVKTLHLCPVR